MVKENVVSAEKQKPYHLSKWHTEQNESVGKEKVYVSLAYLFAEKLSIRQRT